VIKRVGCADAAADLSTLEKVDHFKRLFYVWDLFLEPFPSLPEIRFHVLVFAGRISEVGMGGSNEVVPTLLPLGIA
jgi:hypothetical protein